MLYKERLFYQCEQITGWQREMQTSFSGKIRLIIALITLVSLHGCTSMSNMAAQDVEISDEAIANLEIDTADIKSREQIMCGIGRPESNRAAFTPCLAVITTDKIEFLIWNKYHPEKIEKLLVAPLKRFESVELVKYGNGASLRQVILRNAENMIVMSYSRNEVDIAENVYKLVTEAGVNLLSAGTPVSAETNPEGIAPIIFPLQ